MATLNRKTKTPAPKTHEGAPAKRISAHRELKRAVLSTFLWEDQFYENGQSIGDRITSLVAQCNPNDVADLCIDARTQYNLRHVPLLILTALLKHPKRPANMAEIIAKTIQRPDEMGELISIYWKDGKRPLAAPLKKGIAQAFGKFNEYSLAKFDGNNKAVKLRDVMFLTHPKPAKGRAALYKRIANGEMKTPDTWETALSAGADKKATFERLITEGKLGYLALLRNLRNMEQAGVDRSVVTKALRARENGAERVLPFRYIAAARHAPSFEPAIDGALVASLKDMDALDGTTAVYVDVSGSMVSKVGGKSELTRMDAAATLASIIPGDVRIFTFSNLVKEVPARKGMAGVEAIKRSQPHSGTRLGDAVSHANSQKFDRVIFITDEQSSQPVPNPKAENAYMINVASYKNGVGYGKWTHIDGFSERVLTWIKEYENANFSDL